MKTLRSICAGAALLFAAALPLFGAAPDAQRLKDVISWLDLDRPGMEEVKTAKTPEAQTGALLNYFRNRPVDWSRLKKHPDKKDVSYSDAALEHRFVGQSAYGLVDRGTPIDWDDLHTKDREWIWQFHRFYWWPCLGVRYYDTKDERYAQEWANELNAWVDHMFSKKYYRRHPGWRALEVGLRMQCWAKNFDYFAKSPALDGRTLVNFLYSLYRHGEMVDGKITEELKKKIHNWAVMIQEAQLNSFLWFPEFKKSAQWRQNGLDRLKDYQMRVMLPDGVICELVPSYHCIYPETFYTLRENSRKNGLKAEFGEEYDRRIQNGVTAIMIWTHPDGNTPLFGDAFEGTRSRGYVGKFAKRYPERKDWLWFSSSGEKGEAPRELLNVLPDAGYYTMRTDWSAKPVTFLVMKNSYDTFGWGHNHPDNMTFEISFNGERVMVDSGSFIYGSMPEQRAFFTASRHHQVVTLDGKNNAALGKFLFQKMFGKDLMVTALENAPAKDLTHQRVFFLVAEKYVVVLDFLTGAAQGELRCHYQFTERKHTFLPEKKTAFNDKIVLTGDSANGEMVEEEGWISRRYAKKTERPAFAYVQKKEKGKAVEFLTMIVPATGKDFQPSIRFAGGFHSPKGSFIMEPARGEKYRVTYDMKAGTASVTRL